MSEGEDRYFATEAAGHLDQLERLLSLPGVPDPDHLLRLAAGVRGVAQIAKADTVASIAERLEDAARSLLTNNISWSEDVRTLARTTVDDLKLTVRAFSRWGVEEERRVRSAVEEWDELADGQAHHEAGPARRGDSSRESANSADRGNSELQPHAAPTVSEDEVSTISGGDSVTAEIPMLSRVVPISALFYDDGGLGIIEASATAPVVPVESLLLRGNAALEEALALRSVFENIARGDPVTDPSLGNLVDELFDLVELGMTADQTEA